MCKHTQEMFPEHDWSDGRNFIRMRAKARRLVEDIDYWLYEDNLGTWVNDGHRLAGRCQECGAHSVARAIEWLMLPSTMEEFTWRQVDRVSDIAERWLQRQEAL